MGLLSNSNGIHFPCVIDMSPR